MALIASPIKVPRLSFSCLSPCLWMPITFNVLYKIIGEPDEPWAVGILW